MKPQDNRRNNLLLITFDQFRGDWCDPYAPVLPLPNIEKLGREGWTFRRCYTTSPHCIPARLSWITGLYPSQLGIDYDIPMDLPPDAPSVIRPFKESGWHTEVIGKTHFTSHSEVRDLRSEENRIKALGFNKVLEIGGPKALRRVTCELTDEWKKAGVLDKYRNDMNRRYSDARNAESWRARPTVLPLELYPDIWITRRALGIIKSLPTDKPWIFWVSFVGPHEPFDTPPPWSGMHQEHDLLKPMPPPAWIKSLPEDSVLRKVQEKWSDLLLKVVIEACRKDYADHLRLLDDQVGQLLSALDNRPDKVKTAIALTSDHGELLGDAGMLYKSCFLEGAVRVPWIYRPAPDEKAITGLYSDKPAGVNHLLEQSLHATGTPSAFEDWTNHIPDVCVEFNRELLVIKDRLKLVLGKNGKPQWATDLQRDPFEQENVLQRIPDFPGREPEWVRLQESAMVQFRIRKNKKWIWKDLSAEFRSKNRQRKWYRFLN